MRAAASRKAQEGELADDRRGQAPRKGVSFPLEYLRPHSSRPIWVVRPWGSVFLPETLAGEMTKRSARDAAPRVLLVEADRREADRLEGILRAEFDVLRCPGPPAPEYTCPGGRGEHCTFACEADVIVLDQWVEGDTFLQGTTGWELLFYYRSLGKIVVVLVGDEDPLRPLPDPFVLAIERAPDRDSLLSAVTDACTRLADGRGAVGETIPDAVVPSMRGKWTE